MAQNDNQTQSGVDMGLFNFGGLMNDFYNYKPDGDDDEGRMLKNAFQANMIQSGFDAMLAQQLGSFNAGLSQQNMTHQADLEQRNQAGL